MTDKFQLDNRLKRDTHLLIETNDYLILLHKNATIPWIIIVPKTHILEIFELPRGLQNTINVLTKHIAHIFNDLFTVEKMNIAAIGNIVSQLHIHVIGRKKGDACWPDVVWGNKYEFTEYTNTQIEVLKNHCSKLDT